MIGVTSKDEILMSPKKETSDHNNSRSLNPLMSVTQLINKNIQCSQI